jgi:sugar phosphate permease
LIPINHVAWIFYITPLLAIFCGLTKAFSMALLTRITSTDMRGQVMGINSSASALAQSIPAIIAGYAAAYYSSLPILVGAIVIIFSGVLFIVLKNSDNL